MKKIHRITFFILSIVSSAFVLFGARILIPGIERWSLVFIGMGLAVVEFIFFEAYD